MPFPFSINGLVPAETNMASPFMNIRYHAQREGQAEAGPSFAAEPSRSDSAPKKNLGTDEAAARYFLGLHFAGDHRKGVRGLTAPGSPELMPDLSLKSVQDMPGTKTKLLQFEQRRSSVPVFGSNAVVELDRKKQLVSLDADVVEVAPISAVPTIDQPRALAKIAEYTAAAAEDVRVDEPGALVFFHQDSTNTWHLAFLFKNVPVAPPQPKGLDVPPPLCHGAGASLRHAFPRFDYLVDAHDGQVLFAYSAVATFIPTQLRGIDELGDLQKFWGRQNGAGFLLEDPVRGIKTYDLNQLIAGSDPPSDPIRVAESNVGKAYPAAVSAHANATKVYKFLNSFFDRKGIDGKGMELVSVINCTDPESKEKPPYWSNAEWFKGRMWYGQTEVDGKSRSFACHLDIIAHELAHGVTEFSSKLVYFGQSGALNESFSDIFGVIINNWYGPNQKDVKKWVWEIGKGLGKPGGDGKPVPLRDMANPSRIEFFQKTEVTKDLNNHYPDHFKDYFDPAKLGWGNWDSGGVHVNSNIHNKAAYHVLTAVGAGGVPVFDPEDVAVLYYHCLIRLNMMADFAKVKQVLIDVATTFFAGDPELGVKLGHLQNAYANVGL